MTTPALHTPTPWRIAPPSKGKNRICRAADLRLIADANNYNEQADANAAFIVRACNSHDAFKRLLERASKSIQDWCDSRDYMPDEDAELLAEIRAALAAAEAE